MLLSVPFSKKGGNSMDFRCFLIKGDWVERLSDGCQMKIKEVHANEIVCNDYD